MINPATKSKPAPEGMTAQAYAPIDGTSEDACHTDDDTCGNLSAAVEGSKKAYAKAREKVVAGAHAADDAIHKRPYVALAAGVGLGALVGLLVARRSSRGDR